MKKLAVTLACAALCAVTTFGYDTHNCPVQPLACDVTTNAILGDADCKNTFTVPVHLFSFVGMAGQTVSLFVDLYPFDNPILSLYGPGDTTPAATGGITGYGSSTASINSYQLTRDGMWIVAVTAIDPYAIYITKAPFTLNMTCRASGACDNPPAITQQPRSATISPRRNRHVVGSVCRT